MREAFGLVPIEYPTTRKFGASTEERAKDLVDAFSNPDIKAVFATIGGDDQVTYVSNLPSAAFADNPKPFFGYSDNTHFENFLWLHGVPSYYGGSIMTQFAMQSRMDEMTVRYLRYALFETGERELEASLIYNDVGLGWADVSNLKKERTYEDNDGWYWDGEASAEGTSWGGCVESIDKIFQYDVAVPSLEQFADVILFLETSEDIPSADYVRHVVRTLGERGILERVRGVLVGRPKAWEFDKPSTSDEKRVYKAVQREAILETVRIFNSKCPVVQNLDIGHTDPQVPLPNGRLIKIDADARRISAEF